MNQEEKPGQSTASEDRSCRPTAQGAQDPERHADVSGAATNITRDENKEIDKSAEPLPHEWHQLMCRVPDWTFPITPRLFPQLDREWNDMTDQEWWVETPGLKARYQMLWDGKAKRVLGITSEEADLRLAELLARHGVKPTVVFFVFYLWHGPDVALLCEDEVGLDTWRYIRSVVDRVFRLLFEERLSDGLVQLIDEERTRELFRSLYESDDVQF